MLAGLGPASLARLRFPLADLTKPEVREIAARRRPRGRRPSREPGPLLPRRPGQARVPAPPRRPGRAPGRAGRTLRPAARHPPGPPQLHRRPAPRASAWPRRPRRSTCSRPTPPPTGSWSARASSSEPRRVTIRGARLHRGRRAGSTRSGSATTPRVAAAAPSSSIRRRTTARARSLLAEPVDGVAPGQVACLMDGRPGRRPRHDRLTRPSGRRQATGRDPRLGAMKADEIRKTYLSLLRGAGAQDRALGLAGARRRTTPRCC